MELNINQSCQLIISGTWDVSGFDSNTENKIELLVHLDDPSIYKIETNRSDTTLVWNLEKDGLYKYVQINLPKNVNLDTMDAVKLIEYLNNPTNSVDFVEKQIFSICKLRTCTIQLEKEAIHNFVNNHNIKSCKKDSGQSVKDLLLIAVFVLENLISQERYTEAQMIINSLDSCGVLCRSQKLQTCNCNG